MRECVIATDWLESNVIERIMYLDLSPSLAHYWLHVAFTRQNGLLNIRKLIQNIISCLGKNWSSYFWQWWWIGCKRCDNLKNSSDKLKSGMKWMSSTFVYLALPAGWLSDSLSFINLYLFKKKNRYKTFNPIYQADNFHLNVISKSSKITEHK